MLIEMEMNIKIRKTEESERANRLCAKLSES